MELSARAAACARRKGLDVENTPLGDEADGSYDFIYAVGVLEHVPSPRAFLSEACEKLKPGGYLLTAQPVQDVPSYDIFYVDHLHHFASEHLNAYARITGFEPVSSETGYKVIPNFSMHLFRKDGPGAQTLETGHVETLANKKTISSYLEVFRDVNEHLLEDLRKKSRLGVFGLSNVFALLRAYTELAEPGIAALIDCGIDDAPENYESGSFDFPIVTPTEALFRNLDCVYLCTSPSYHQSLIPRLKGLGFKVYNCLGALVRETKP